jgi:hypothetical protein
LLCWAANLLLVEHHQPLNTWLLLVAVAEHLRLVVVQVAIELRQVLL